MREMAETPGSGESPDGRAAGRRRFTIAAGLGLGVALIPYLWVLWGGRLDPLRRSPSGYFSNFFDLQARALAHGHWWVPKGSLGIEAFVLGGHDYMYFGPFPALLRMPILAVTHSLDGRLTAPSMLLAWFVTGLFSSLLLWRIRVLMRGSAALGRAEAVGLGVLLATVMCGSTLMFLAAYPAVYEEALAWGVAMTVGALFALLGVLERPSAGRVVGACTLTLGAVLSRSTLGWGCMIGAVLVAVWFASGRAGARQRPWSLSVLAAGLVPLAIGCTVTWVKFGDAFIQPLGAQVFSHVNKHRHLFLVANGGKAYSLNFVPTTLWAYLRPDGLRISTVYPFITLPSRPPAVLGGVFMDQISRTSSVPAAMPLLFVLGCWGIISVFRRRPPERTNVIRIPVLAAAACGASILAWEGIAFRFTADFLPLLVLTSAVGLIDVFRRLEGSSRRVRAGVGASVAVLALFCVAANLGIATEATRLKIAIGPPTTSRPRGPLPTSSVHPSTSRVAGCPRTHPPTGCSSPVALIVVGRT